MTTDTAAPTTSENTATDATTTTTDATSAITIGALIADATAAMAQKAQADQAAAIAEYRQHAAINALAEALNAKGLTSDHFGLLLRYHDIDSIPF